MLEINNEIDNLITLSLREDLNKSGDVTTNLLLDRLEIGQAAIIAKQDGIIAGLIVANQVFKKVEKKLSLTYLVSDGAKVHATDEIVRISGPIAGILTAERTALNFLQRLSGIATFTSIFVARVQGTRAKILDTRKTTPGLRKLEKYAVRVGGGYNHRIGLYDMILLKENHIEAAGGLTKAVKQIRENMKSKNLNLKIEVEACTLAQVQEAQDLAVDRILLDNMTLAQIHEAVNIVCDKVELEVSGGVTLENVREIAETGVDFISVGALTHSAPAFDMTLLVRS